MEAGEGEGGIEGRRMEGSVEEGDWSNLEWQGERGDQTLNEE